MKIAIDLTPVLKTDGSMGGATLFTLELLKGLADKNSHEYLLLTADYNHEFFEKYENSGMKRLCLLNTSENKRKNNSPLKSFLSKVKGTFPESKIKTFLKNKKKLLKEAFSSILKKENYILKELDIDLLFCPICNPAYSEKGVKTVSIIYDIQHEYYELFFAPGEMNYRKRVFGEICKKTDAIICISEYTKKTFLEKYDYPPEKAYVIPIGIQDRLEKPSEEKLRSVLKKHDLENISYGYYPANFWPHKNHRMLLTAFSKYIKINPSSDLHLVFTGFFIEGQDILKKAAEVMGIQERIHFLGYLPEEDIGSIYSGCKFIVHPSLFEGFGIPLMEGMKFGKPLLCSNVTSLPEIGGDGAIYFDPRKPDEIIEAFEKVNDENLITELCEKARKQLSKFTLENTVNSYLNIFNIVMDNKK